VRTSSDRIAGCFTRRPPPPRCRGLWSCHIDSQAQSFADVPITDAGVDTLAFLEASGGLLGLFGAPILRCLAVNPSIDSFLYLQLLPLGEYTGRVDLLGSAAFAPVQTDIKGNIVVSWQDHLP